MFSLLHIYFHLSIFFCCCSELVAMLFISWFFFQFYFVQLHFVDTIFISDPFTHIDTQYPHWLHSPFTYVYRWSFGIALLIMSFESDFICVELFVHLLSPNVYSVIVNWCFNCGSKVVHHSILFCSIVVLAACLIFLCVHWNLTWWTISSCVFVLFYFFAGFSRFFRWFHYFFHTFMFISNSIIFVL